VILRRVEAVGREKSDRILWEWANQFGDVPADLAADLQREVFDRLAAARVCLTIDQPAGSPSQVVSEGGRSLAAR